MVVQPSLFPLSNLCLATKDGNYLYVTQASSLVQQSVYDKVEGWNTGKTEHGMKEKTFWKKMNMKTISCFTAKWWPWKTLERESVVEDWCHWSGMVLSVVWGAVVSQPA